MSESTRMPFLGFLEAGVAHGGFEADDVLAAMLPLMRQVLAAHEAGRVAPLDGLRALTAGGAGPVAFDPARAVAPSRNSAAVESLQASDSSAVDVVGTTRRVTDLDQGTVTVSDQGVGTSGRDLVRPVFLAGYRCWEHGVGHHDALTDVFSLGQLLASLACGLDFSDAGELELFCVHRANLFAIHPRLNPVLAAVLVQMTELNRHRRAQDLRQLIVRLENYREPSPGFDPDLLRRPEFRESPVTGKRRLIQSHLRDRLFEISRRNRLIHFKPTLQTLNLTVASVPVLLDYRNIRLEQLLVWQPALAAAVTGGSPLSLGKYLRFEDAPYVPGVLDKIIGEARRDRAEYGFAQLRLVLCFLRWNNLKEDRAERIHSPLLLLPVGLTRKKGVRDDYLLDPATTEAEVNPVLRHHLRELYNLALPESVELKETSLDEFFGLLRAQIEASEPGVTLHKIDRPQIELIHEKARQRVDQFRRRQGIQIRTPRASPKPEDSGERDAPQSLGLRLFLEKVRPAPIPLQAVAGAPPERRPLHVGETDGTTAGEGGPVMEAERLMFALREGDNGNPYAWDFDLCSLTLGNFNYRKMTLVRDYARLIETDMESGAFDAVFSLAPRPPEEVPPPALELADQHLVLACDATQASAIARARTGASYIIQGPPGTGKSQTITNLIADHVARGKRVLFVCEKRAAIDVVFQRLRQQGLDALCCLIHDSQTDKKAFVENLRQTYETFLGQSDADPDAGDLHSRALRGMEQELGSLRRFSEAMGRVDPHAGIPLRPLLHRLVERGGPAAPLAPEVEDLLPEYPLWLRHGGTLGRLHAALDELGEETCFAWHPLRWLGRGVLQAARPLEALSRHLDHAESLLEGIEAALELSGLPGEMWDTPAKIRPILDFAVRVRPLAERNLVGVLTQGPAESAFASLAADLDATAESLRLAEERTAGWREPLDPDDTAAALAQMQGFEASFLRLLRPAYWRLRRTLEARYELARHAVPPAWSRILGDLATRHRASAEAQAARRRAVAAWRAEDLDCFRDLVAGLGQDPQLSQPSVRTFLARLAGSGEASALVGSLADLRDRFAEMEAALQAAVAGHERLTLPELAGVLEALRGQAVVLSHLSPLLPELAELPDALVHALRHAPVPLDEFETAMGCKSLNRAYRQDRALDRFEGRTLLRRMEQLESRHREWLGLNARVLLQGVRRRFLEHVQVSSAPAAQLTAEQKAFKKSYAAGRRALEHEFGKTMRFKSIRDLAAGGTGQVIQDLKPVWLMSPLSVSDTLPLDPGLFDVVIFDEASQIPMEEAVPALYRSHQAIVVGDEMQLPPTTFFAGTRTGDEGVVVEDEGERVEVDLDSDSFLTQSAQNLPSTLLAWHYRSRYESLISFSNAAFYGGSLFTIPDRQRATPGRPELVVTSGDQGDANAGALLERSISFHFMENGVYGDRRNPVEAEYIARLVRGLLGRGTTSSIGLVAFSEAQQSEIEAALERLAAADPEFAARLEAESVREENDVFCGLFVKNLENVQGDERDIILMSVCYGHDAGGRMLMNFGPVNQRGGEKRLNVIFSRARHHMAIVSSIRHQDITNDHNDGANTLKNFLHYAEAVSKGDDATARRVLENLNPLSRKARTARGGGDAVVEGLAAALRARGHLVDLAVGQSRFRCDLAVRGASGAFYQLGILVDTEGHYANADLLDRYLMQPGILKAFGWQYTLVLTKDWYHVPGEVLARIENLLQGLEPAGEPEPEGIGVVAVENPVPPALPREGKPAVAGGPLPESGDAAAVAPRRFELVAGGSRKFWEITVEGNAFTVRFGRIGTAGQAQTKTFADPARAAREADALIAEKLGKGYARIP